MSIFDFIDRVPEFGDQASVRSPSGVYLDLRRITSGIPSEVVVVYSICCGYSDGASTAARWILWIACAVCAGVMVRWGAGGASRNPQAARRQSLAALSAFVLWSVIIPGGPHWSSSWFFPNRVPIASAALIAALALARHLGSGPTSPDGESNADLD